MIYRVVQECRCGCGRKRALKSEKPIKGAPAYNHPEVEVERTTEDFAGYVLEALHDERIGNHLDAIQRETKDAIVEIRLKLNALAAWQDDRDKEAAKRVGFWRRMKYLFTGR